MVVIAFIMVKLVRAKKLLSDLRFKRSTSSCVRVVVERGALPFRIIAYILAIVDGSIRMHVGTRNVIEHEAPDNATIIITVSFETIQKSSSRNIVYAPKEAITITYISLEILAICVIKTLSFTFFVICSLKITKTCDSRRKSAMAINSVEGIVDGLVGVGSLLEVEKVVERANWMTLLALDSGAGLASVDGFNLGSDILATSFIQLPRSLARTESNGKTEQNANEKPATKPTIP